MKLILNINDTVFSVGSEPLDISIPLQFDGPQPNTYDVPVATAKAFEGGGFVGDVRQGGSCNFEEYRLIPHCNGTHTECVGHITTERIRVHEELQDRLIPATLITVMPDLASKSQDSYSPEFEIHDRVISSRMIKDAVKSIPVEFYQALIIRTLPNSEEKKKRKYTEHPPAFFSLEAMEAIRSLGVKHLLTDLPSVDRALDEGKLSAHHIFWDMEQGSHEISPGHGQGRTITEMIYVPDSIRDGVYLLNLQIAPFMSDAAPSRPVLFALER